MGADWWERVVLAWNESETCSELAGVGEVGFEVVTDIGCRFICVRWDEKGRGAIINDESVVGNLVLKTVEERWQGIVNKTYDAVSGVIDGWLEVRGDRRKVVVYASGFDSLIRMADALTNNQTE